MHASPISNIVYVISANVMFPITGRVDFYFVVTGSPEGRNAAYGCGALKQGRGLKQKPITHVICLNVPCPILSRTLLWE